VKCRDCHRKAAPHGVLCNQCIAAAGAYERGRAEERADVVAWLRAFAKRLDAINEGKLTVRDQVRRDESILVDGCADSIEQNDARGDASRGGKP
jgi:hypothetical protein